MASRAPTSHAKARRRMRGHGATDGSPQPLDADGLGHDYTVTFRLRGDGDYLALQRLLKRAGHAGLRAKLPEAAG